MILWEGQIGHTSWPGQHSLNLCLILFDIVSTIYFCVFPGFLYTTPMLQ